MAKWNVYRQWNPVLDGPAPKQGEEPNYRAKLVLVGVMEVPPTTKGHPIGHARTLYGLRHPVLHLLGKDGKQVVYDVDKEYQGS